MNVTTSRNHDNRDMAELPAAPLAMPKQVLEGPGLVTRLRHLLAALLPAARARQ